MLENNPSIEKKIPERKSSRLPRFRGALAELDFAETTSFEGGSQPGRGPRATIAWSFAASMIDSLVVVALVCLFLAASLFVERFGFSDFHVSRDFLLKVGALLFVFVHGTYLIMLRIFMGRSLGEWACDLRLGSPRQRFSSRYSLLVLMRFFVVVVTGVVTLPILSLLTGTDLAGRLSGLPLVSLPNRSGK